MLKYLIRYLDNMESYGKKWHSARNHKNMMNNYARLQRLYIYGDN